MASHGPPLHIVPVAIACRILRARPAMPGTVRRAASIGTPRSPSQRCQLAKYPYLRRLRGMIGASCKPPSVAFGGLRRLRQQVGRT